VLEQLRRRTWNLIGHLLRRSDDSIANKTTRLQRKKLTREYLEERSGEMWMVAQLRKGRGGIRRQSWMVTSRL